MTTEHFPALIVVTPLMVSCIVFAAGWFNRNVCFPLVITALTACLIFAAGLAAAVLRNDNPLHYHLGAWPPPWGIEYVVDHLNALILLAIAVIALLTAVYSRSMAAREFPETKLPQFYTLYLLQVTGLFGITITGDVFNLYVLVEIASFSAYAMIGMGERGAAFAAFRYMIFGTSAPAPICSGSAICTFLPARLTWRTLTSCCLHYTSQRPCLPAFPC